MKISAADAALLSERERKMVESTGPWRVQDLVSLIRRLRDLRDKQRDLVQRQRIQSARTTGSKGGRTGKANVRTGDKSRVLDRALKHFEAELARLDRDSSDAVRSLGAGKPVAPKKKANKGERKVARRAVKAAAGEVVAKKAPAKKAARKAVAKKTAASKAPASKVVAKKAVAKKKAKPAAKGPAKALSSKTRVEIPRSLGAAASRQRVGQASQRSRGKKTR